MRKFLGFVAIALITISIFVIIFSRIDFYNTFLLFGRINPYFLFLSLVFVSVSLIVYAYRWSFAMKKLNYHLSFKESLIMLFGGHPLLFLFPFESGEIFKSFYLKNTKNIPHKDSIASIICFLASDFYMLLFFSMIGIFAFGLAKNVLVILYGIIMIALLTAFFKTDVIKRFQIKFLGKKVQTSVNGIISSISKVNKERISIFAFSVFMVISLILLDYSIFKAFGLNIPLYEVFIFIPLIMLLSRIPVTISGFGTREVLILIIFSSYGASETLLASALLIGFVSHVLPLFGSILFAKGFFNSLFLKKFSLK